MLLTCVAGEGPDGGACHAVRGVDLAVASTPADKQWGAVAHVLHKHHVPNGAIMERQLHARACTQSPLWLQTANLNRSQLPSFLGYEAIYSPANLITVPYS